MDAQRHRGDVRFHVGPSRRALTGEVELLIYLLEGKASLESYEQLFRYMEKLIGMQRARHPLAAAVKVILG